MRDSGKKVMCFLNRLAAAAAISSLAACAAAPGGSSGAGDTSANGATRGVEQAAPVETYTAAKPALVALLAPLTADNARVRNLAKSLSDAANMAKTDLADPRIQLKVYDSAKGAAGRAAQQAIADGASIFIGPLFAGAARNAGAIAAGAGLKMIAFSTDATVAGGNVYLIGFLPQREVDRVMSFAGQSGYDSIATFAPQTPYGELAASAARDAARRYGLSMDIDMSFSRSFEGIERGAKEFAAAYKGGSSTRAVLIPESGKALQTAGAFLSYNGVSPKRVKYLGLGPWNAPATLKEPSLKRGWFAAPDPRLHNEFVSRFQSANGYAPPELAALGYDAMAAVGAMMQEANGVDPFNAGAIEDPSGFRGVNGAFRFSADGLNDRALAILEVKGNGFTVVDPAPSGFGAGS